jgi:Amt family ammonium transporter
MDKPLQDILWVLTATALVFVMQAGFLCLEAGLTRKKNSINVAIKNVADFGISMLSFWLFGFAIMFGATQQGWIGNSHFGVDLSRGEYWLTTFFLFQVVFCGTTVTIVSGAVAERVRFSGYLLMAGILGGILYPIYGHWAWGGMIGGEPGWLAKMGFVDFAGSTVVHSLGGWAALAAAIIVGPRAGRFRKGQPPLEIAGSNLPLAMLGTLLLWFGWIGFNGGSTLELNEQVPAIIANTMLAAAAGIVGATATIYALRGYAHPIGIMNGTIAGLVAITANCHAVSPLEAILIGVVGGALSIVFHQLLERCHVDDAVSAAPCHLVAGVWGTLAVGLFGDLSILDTGLSRLEQIRVQSVGILACGLWAGGVGFALIWLLDRIYPMRVSAEAEQVGLNIAEHHAANDLQDFIGVIERQSKTGDLSLRASVEPFTEVGQIAEHYNELMSVLEKSKADIRELVDAKAALEEALEKAKSADQAKSEFLANMSHEVRTPLHGILSFANLGLMKAENAKPERILDYFRKIDLSGQRMLQLVNALLDLAKLEAGKMSFAFEKQDMVPLIHTVMGEFTSLLSERDISLKFHPQAKSTWGQIDPAQIMQVVRNLIGNAAKFSPDHATIGVRLEQSPDTLRLEIRDHGEGIPADELEVVFDKFIQSSKTKTGAGGTGLGLAICKEIVAGHGGRIWAQNHAEGGAVFTVELPLHQDAAKETSLVSCDTA